MPTGIDVGTTTVVVATPDGTTSSRNAVRRIDPDDRDADESTVTVRTDEGTYAVGGDPPDERTNDDPPPLFGDAPDLPAGVRREAVEAFLDEFADETGRLRYVTDDDRAGALLADVATAIGHDAADLDPGMAVLYDGLDSPPTGLGVAVREAAAVGTLAVAGVPVATARVDRDDLPLDRDLASGPGGTSGSLATLHYEPLLGQLAADLAASAPALADPVPVVFGGAGAPDGRDDGATADHRFADPLAAELPFEVASVTVADASAEALARGALTAAEADDGSPASTPAYAVDVPWVPALADPSAAAAALGEGVTRVDGTVDGIVEHEDVGGGAGAGTALAASGLDSTGVDVEAVQAALAATRRDLAALERQGCTTARALAEFATEVEEAGVDGERLDQLRTDLDAVEEAFVEDEQFDDLASDIDAVRETVADLADAIDRIEEGTATAERVADLDDSLADLGETVERLESDTERIRAVIAGIDDDAVQVDTPEFEGAGVDAVRADAIQDDLDALESRIDEQLGHVWDEFDGIDDELVDLRATVRDVPDVEDRLASTREELVDLADEIAAVQSAVDDIDEALATTRERTATTAAVREVAADVEDVAADLDSLRAEFEGTERADPEVVAELRTDVNGLRQTFIERAERLEALEEDVGDLEERVETVYRNSAKSEALSSAQTEISRVQQTAARSIEKNKELEETVASLAETVGGYDDRIDDVSTTVENLVGNAATRSEMRAEVENVESRLSELTHELEEVRATAREDSDLEPAPEVGLAITSLAAGVVGLGVFGALFAGLQNSLFVAAGFLVVGTLTGMVAWLVD